MGRLKSRLVGRQFATLSVLTVLPFGLPFTSFSQTIQMKIRPIFDGLPLSTDRAVMYVEIENRGDGVDGELITDGDNGGGTRYPVSLPSGSKKRVFFQTPTFYSGSVLFQTRFRSVRATYQSEYSSTAANRYVLISNNPNDLLFLRSAEQAARNQNTAPQSILTGGSLPEDAPDRDVAYREIDTVVLGEGSERLEKAQRDAIRRYLVSGGNVVFVGGAATSAAKDPNWSDLLPVLNAQVVNKGGVAVFDGTRKVGAGVTKLPFGASVSVPFGFGKVSLLTADPLEEPFRSSAERRGSVLKVISKSGKESIMQGINNDLGVSQGYESSGSRFGMIPNRQIGAVSRDAFDIKAPSSNSVFVVLVIYIIFVVPINFLVLKKLKRLEWAWMTVPAISVVFSLIFLRSTVALYSAAATTRTTAFALLDGSGKQESVLVFGKSEMFFPSAGQYDLKLKNTDSVGDQQRVRTKIDFVDVGSEVIAPAVSASNLNFREFTFDQWRSDLIGIECAYDPLKRVLRIRNGSNLNLRNPLVLGVSSMKTIENELKPGAIVTIEFSKGELEGQNLGSAPGSTLTESLRASIRNSAVPMMVSLFTNDVRVGPDHGTVHPDSRFQLFIRPNLETL